MVLVGVRLRYGTVQIVKLLEKRWEWIYSILLKKQNKKNKKQTKKKLFTKQTKNKKETKKNERI